MDCDGLTVDQARQELIRLLCADDCRITQRAEAEGQLTMALKGLLAVAEAYPQLQASQQFRDLQNSLSGLESDIQNSRRYYNAVVRDLNTKIAVFPSNIFAGMLGFQPRQFFEIGAGERENVAVKF